jgi:light-regulated signal transduction histidine kinase (bacteriophytochrome)
MKAESYVGVTLWSFQGQPIGLIAVIGRKPLVNPKLAESILRLVAIRAAAELERRDAEEELKRRAAQLEEANKELESFSYSVSHDLRSPLRAIDGYSRMILRKRGDQFDEDTRRKFNVIRDSTRIMGQLIDDLLALSRLGGQVLSVSQLNVETLTRDVWEELKIINPDRPIDMKIDSVPSGMADRSLIKQVLVNLLSNAIKFSRTRQVPVIEVSGYVAENENVYYVRDNGVGFDMQYYDKLFRIFQRLHSADDFEGTGIGLAIVQRIIRRHGGRVWAESEPGKGATFYFTLPKYEGSGV